MRLPDIHALNNDRTRLQLVSQQLAVAHSSLREGQAFLSATLENCLNHYGAQEHKCKEYFKSYKLMEGKYASLLNDMHSMAGKNLSLHGEIDKRDGIIDAANSGAAELEAFCNDLSETNMTLRQNVDQAHEMIRVLQNRIVELEPPTGVATGLKTTDIHELESVVQMSPEAKIVELKQSEDGDNGLDAQETNSIISFVSKRASPSPGNGERQNAEERKTDAGHGRQKQRKRGRGGPKKPTRATPDLSVTCG
jgi:hypothetical protein